MRTSSRLITSIVIFAAGLFGQAPAPNSVQNPASNILPGLPNFGIAQGSIFVVYGSNLGPSALSVAPSLPLTNSLSGTSIKVTVNGTTVDAPILYTLRTQVAGVLPSSTPVGSGTLSVTYNGASGSTPIQVVKSNFGISTVNQTGTGPAIITFGDYSLVTGTKSAKAGDTLILWGTGLGPVSGSDAAAPNPVDLGTPVTVYVGGQQATVVYRGRSVEPGLDQINFVVPAGVTGCAVSIVVQTNNMVSNTATMPVSRDNGPCSDPNGISVSALTPALNSKGAVNIGVISLFQDSITIDILGTKTTSNTAAGSAIFERFTAAQIGSVTGLAGQGSVGSCTVSVYSANADSSSPAPAPVPVPQVVGLDAGAAITMAPSGGSPIVLSQSSEGGKGVYYGNATSLPGGSTTISNGAGGADIGAFSKTINFAAPLVWSNQAALSSAPIDRTKPIDIAWTGGDPSTYAFIEGTSTAVTSTTSTLAVFICIAPVSAGHFTIPTTTTLSLPATNTQSVSPMGLLIVGSISNPVQFTAPGLDFGYAYEASANGASVTWQ